MTKILAFYCAFSFLSIKSQAQLSSNPCSSPEALQFDFWVGNWELVWNDTSKGTNHIEKILGSCVVQENFSDPVGMLVGKSWSMYNPATKEWQQTWVDNQGGYICLKGKYVDSKMILSTLPIGTSNGNRNISRMIFYNITKNSFDWNWEKSTDDGKTWVLSWKIHYIRKNFQK